VCPPDSAQAPDAQLYEADHAFGGESEMGIDLPAMLRPAVNACTFSAWWTPFKGCKTGYRHSDLGSAATSIDYQHSRQELSLKD